MAHRIRSRIFLRLRDHRARASVRLARHRRYRIPGCGYRGRTSDAGRFSIGQWAASDSCAAGEAAAGVGAALVRESGMLSAEIRDGLAGAFRSHRRERVFARLRIGAPGRARKRSRVPARRRGLSSALWTGFTPTPISWKVCCRCSIGPSAPRPFEMAWIAPAAICARSRPLFARSDVYAQLLRVRLLGEALGALPLDRSAAAHEAEQAASFQIALRAILGSRRIPVRPQARRRYALRQSGFDRVLRAGAGTVERSRVWKDASRGAIPYLCAISDLRACQVRGSDTTR